MLAMAAGWWYPLANSTCNFLPRSRQLPNFYDGKCTDLLPANHAAQASNNFVLGNDRSRFLRDQNYAILALGKLLPTTKSTDVKFQANWLHIRTLQRTAASLKKETVVGHLTDL